MKKDTIRKLIDSVVKQEIFFEDFVEQSVKEGIERVTLDLLKGVHTFYSDNDAFDHRLPEHYRFKIAKAFSESSLKKAIASIDSREISPFEFYSQLASSGVWIGHVFLKSNCIVYVGIDGSSYLEQW